MDPITWIQIALLVISLVISYANRPKVQNAKPPELSDYGIPTVEEGRDIAWIHGEVWITDFTIAGWGNVRTTPIRASGGK